MNAGMLGVVSNEPTCVVLKEIEMKTLNVFEIWIWDGGGGSRHGFYVESEEAAKEWVTKNNYDSYYKKTITIFDNLVDYEENSHEGLKKKALAKLSDAEKSILGIKE